MALHFFVYINAEEELRSKTITIMKKIFTLCLVAVAVAFVANANDSSNVNRSNSNNMAADNPTQSSELNAEAVGATIFYDGPAYSAGEGLIPKPADSVSVYWTSEGCSINGNTGYIVSTISGDGFPMFVNGKVKYMNFFVNYKGDRYFFQR